MRYVKLKCGMIIREGDEVRVPRSGCWILVKDSIGRKVGRGTFTGLRVYRRPIKGKAPKTPRTKAQKVSVAAKRSHNKPCAPALWRELNRSCPMKVPLKTDWVPVTEKRLNSAMKRLNFAQG